MTQHFIVIGNPITHSKSPAIHQAFAKQVGVDIVYNRQYCPADKASFAAVTTAFMNGGGIGANVTVPFKQDAFELCQAQAGVSEYAKVAGAVNTLIRRDNGWYGDNTDGRGLVDYFQHLRWPLAGAKVAIIGAGGASRGIILPLIEAGVTQITVANRTVNKAQAMVDEMYAISHYVANTPIEVCPISELDGAFDIIINATSIGLSGETLPLMATLTGRYAFDMMYGRPLPFLTHFEQQGAHVADGYGMLLGQAALSFEQWTGKSVEPNQLLQADIDAE